MTRRPTQPLPPVETPDAKEQAVDLVDSVQCRLSEQQAIALSFEAIFEMAARLEQHNRRTDTNGYIDTGFMSDLWQGFGYLSKRLAAELEEISDEVGQLYALTPKGGAQ